MATPGHLRVLSREVWSLNFQNIYIADLFGCNSYIVRVGIRLWDEKLNHFGYQVAKGILGGRLDGTFCLMLTSRP